MTEDDYHNLLVKRIITATVRVTLNALTLIAKGFFFAIGAVVVFHIFGVRVK